MVINRVDLPPFETTMVTVEWIQDMNCGATYFPKLHINSCLKNNYGKNSLAATTFHICTERTK